MKKIVIYYSFEGNTRLMAENIAKTINANILELKPKKDIKSKGFMKYIRCGKAVMMKSKPELLPFDKDFHEYDILFIGTPVWMGNYAPALNTFLSANKIVNKKIALFCCHGEEKCKIFDKLKENLKDNQILGEIDFLDPLKNNTEENIEKARKWAEMITKNII